jgi:MoxR-like ATPase
MGGNSLKYICIISFSFCAFASSARAEEAPLKEIVQTAEACETELTMPSLEQAADRQSAFFAALKKRLLERDEAVDLIELALLAKEHVLLVGPPGNAKSMIVDLIGKNIKEAGGQESYFKIQLTPETTQNEIIGPLSPKDLLHHDRYRRLVEEGVLAAKFAFFDEIFDGNPKTLRDILGVLNERAHAQALRIHPGKLETAIAASNKYPSQVYERAAQLHDEDGPKAVFDRIGLVIYITPDFFDLNSDKSLIQNKFAKVAIPQLTFQDLDAVRAKVKDVEIPDHVASFLSLLSHRLKQHLSSLEEKSLLDYKRMQQSGEIGIDPPYRSTKYHSKRTLGKAASFLRAIVVQDWLKTGRTRPLVATLEDLKKLEVFFSLNGADSLKLDEMMQMTNNRHEKVQLLTIRIEKEAYQGIYADLLKDVNSEIYQTSLAEIQVSLKSLQSDDEKRAYAKKLVQMRMDYEELSEDIKPWENSGERIGKIMLRDYVEASLKELVGQENFEKDVLNVLADLKEERRLVLEEQQKVARAEQERLAAEERTRQAKIARIKEMGDTKQAQVTALLTSLQEKSSKGENYSATAMVNNTNNVDQFHRAKDNLVETPNGSLVSWTQQGRKLSVIDPLGRESFYMLSGDFVGHDNSANARKVFALSDTLFFRIIMRSSNEAVLEFTDISSGSPVISTSLEYFPQGADLSVYSALVEGGAVYLPYNSRVWKEVKVTSQGLVQRSFNADFVLADLVSSRDAVSRIQPAPFGLVLPHSQLVVRVKNGSVQLQDLSGAGVSGLSEHPVYHASQDAAYLLSTDSQQIRLHSYVTEGDSVVLKETILDISEMGSERPRADYSYDSRYFRVTHIEDMIVLSYMSNNGYHRSVFDRDSGKLYKTWTIDQTMISGAPMEMFETKDGRKVAFFAGNNSYQIYFVVSK